MSIPVFTDNDIMPFGQHCGKKMANVPAVYLIYIYDKGWCNNYPGVKQYIQNNMDVLKNQAGQKNKSYR